jgi:BioD-like phosphotransacetylase family protein
MNFLIKAMSLVESRGDDDWFCEIYSNYREFNGVKESIFMTLSYLYNNEVAENFFNDVKN